MVKRVNVLGFSFLNGEVSQKFVYVARDWCCLQGLEFKHWYMYLFQHSLTDLLNSPLLSDDFVIERIRYIINQIKEFNIHVKTLYAGADPGIWKGGGGGGGGL